MILVYPIFYDFYEDEQDMKKIDKEYATSFVDEYKYLRNCGIRYEYVKTDENNITIWKYKKSPKLFECLKNFYVNNEYY
jgi:hypothetical protein